jgi:hypothetical protein
MRLLSNASILILALSAPGALAADAPSGEAAVQKAVGATIVETYGDGRRAEIWLKADHTYTGEGRRRDMSSGTWSVEADKLCFKQSHPFVFGARFCTPIPAVGLGQPWQAKSATGEAIKVKVEPGHVVPS